MINDHAVEAKTLAMWQCGRVKIPKCCQLWHNMALVLELLYLSELGDKIPKEAARL